MKEITNPSGAFGQTDPESNHFQVVTSFEVVGAVAVAAHDAVTLVWNETTRTLMCEPWDTDAAGQSGTLGALGVALDGGSAGTKVRVVTHGFALVNIGTGTATEGEWAIGSTTKGQVTSRALGAAGTQSLSSLGSFLGDEDGALNIAPIWVNPCIFIDATA